MKLDSFLHYSGKRSTFINELIIHRDVTHQRTALALGNLKIVSGGVEADTKSSK